MSDRNPYLLDLPAVVSFSGGRTSGFMLRHILDAHGGQPDNLKVCFQNTGLEHPATYDFVREVQERWGVDVVWLEYFVNEDNKHDYKIVGFDTASRGGEPFTALIKKKKYLPNPVARICTVNLKVDTLKRYLKTLPAFDDGYTNALGLRFDEPRRVHRVHNRDDMCCPVFLARHTEEDVLAWWKANDFDLQLPTNGRASNCVGCFLKGRGRLEELMVEMPEHFAWWVEAEELIQTATKKSASFRSDRPSYASMVATVKAQGRLFDVDGEDTIPCMCTD